MGAMPDRDIIPLDRNANLETVLAAWHDATVRLEQTHETLRAEVSRLTVELELKNRELARKNRLEDLGRIASHVAHEVRNSLMPVTLYLSLLRRRLDTDPGSCDILDKVDGSVTAVDATVNDLLHFAADREPVCRVVRLREVVQEVIKTLAPQLDAQGIQADVDVPLQASAWADRDMLRRAILNLALNAIDAMSDGGELTITAYQSSGGLELEIADSGPGVAQEHRARVFEPFFTTKSTGTGLGLAIVERIAAAHGGEVRLMNCPEGGAAFTLRFPRRVWEQAA
jgi:signal transduction histidine kinase